MREHVPVGRAVAHGDANQQRAVEPSAILVRPFEIHVRRPRQFLPVGIEAVEHRQMRRTRIEPHIQNVGFLAPAATRRSEQRVPAGSNSSTVCVNHASAPSRVNHFARVRAAPHNRQTACRTCRNKESPAARPRSAAAKRTSPAAPRSSSEFARRPTPASISLWQFPRARARGSAPAPVPAPSRSMNHCSVARKITGLWQRQQCG